MKKIMDTIEKIDDKFERFFEWLNEDGDRRKKNSIVIGMFVVLFIAGALVEGAMQ